MSEISNLKISLRIARDNQAELQKDFDEKTKELNERVEALRAEFNTSNAELIDNLNSINETVRTADERLREKLIEHFKSTGEKHFDQDLSVRVNPKLQYDEKKAFEWAVAHSLCLMLDKRAFEQIAKIQEFDFVETIEVPVAVVAKNFDEPNLTKQFKKK